MRLALADEAATLALGAELARRCPPGTVIHLHGDLGAGKTTLARGFLRELGWTGPVRSPTYTLLEPYDLPAGTVVHLDLYRLADPEELEYLGLDDLLAARATMLVEWPRQGGDRLPKPGLTVQLQPVGTAREALLEGLAECLPVERS
ncbi:MAG: tRNA (adenosine(37)-N6)-threonylcarbamoyltransferase complex ATPase subunit type 1 TsaE [Chromatiales bacterium]|nr:tRNA (adenosine(37)-N6)-threonylcarbamoyltransferase complex ATPase subunit type 1 TsaE [Chromatiales bacterium]